MAIAPEDYQSFKPLCFATLGAFIQREVPDVQLQVADNVADVLEQKPDLVWISSGSINFNLARSHARQIKQALGIPVWIGGVHISVLPYVLPAEFDIGVLGEAEQTCAELLELVKAGRTTAGDLSAVMGIAFHNGESVQVNERRPLIEPLDLLPIPDRELVGYSGEPAYMFTSRGCPYDCAFCSSQAFWGKYRAHSVERIIEEAGQLIDEFGCSEIHFFDDLFVADKKRLAGVADGVVERGWAGNVKLSCTLRANLVTHEIMDLLNRMQMERVTFGAESCSDPVLRYLKGDSVNAEMNQRAVDLCAEHGIKVGPSFIKGAPDETAEDLFKTYEFILRNIRDRKIDYFEMHNLTPFPGTKIWHHALAEGIVSEQMDWEELRVPWERLYMSRTMPKTSFYFFDDLTKLAQRMLRFNDHHIIGLLDVTGLAAVDDGVRTAGQWADQALEEGFLDMLVAVDFESEKPHPELQEALAERDVRLVLRSRIKSVPGESWKDPITVYFKPLCTFDGERLKSMVWHHFLDDADYTTHAPSVDFTPASPFAQSLIVFSERALTLNRQAYFEKTRAGEPFPDIKIVLKSKRYKLSVFRPERDPWIRRSPARGELNEILSRNWKLDRMSGDKLERRIQIIEQRIIDDAEKLTQREIKARKRRKG